MKVAGIIAEYDPLHTGHAWQIKKAKSLGAECIVCVMSPDVVQRGGVSILPIQVRVQAALLCGADLIIELPAPYAASSAEFFAQSAVGLLNAMGCVDTLIFGSETGQTDLLVQLAEVLLSEEYQIQLKKELKKGDSFPVARNRAVQHLVPQWSNCLQKPNDILGIEYCKAILQQNAEISPVALYRQGAGHGASPSHGFSSASWLREQFQKSRMNHWTPYIPAECQFLYQQVEQQGLFLNKSAMEIGILSRLRAMDLLDFQKVRGMTEGLEYRLNQAVQQATGLEDLYQRIKSKRYPHARIRRLVLDATLQVPKELPIIPPYLHILGASKKGLEVLSKAKPTMDCSTSLAKLAKQSPQNCAIIKIHANAQDFAGLCREKIQPKGLAYTTPLIQKETIIRQESMPENSNIQQR